MSISRRDFVGAGASAAAGAALGSRAPLVTEEAPPVSHATRAGRLRQSASRWCYQAIPLPDLCRAGTAMGLAAIDATTRSFKSLQLRLFFLCELCASVFP